MIDEANEAECAINRVLTTLVNLEVLGKSLVGPGFSSVGSALV